MCCLAFLNHHVNGEEMFLSCVTQLFIFVTLHIGNCLYTCMIRFLIIYNFFFYRLQNPCTSRTCAPTYSFHNDLPLTRNVDDFVESVNKVDISSNIDNLEGGLDAMMQAVVCKVHCILFYN